MTDPAPPLTAAELVEYARLVLATQLATERGREATHQAIDEYQSFTEKHGGDFEAFMVVIKMAQKSLALESELAESTRERYAAIREMAKAREERMDAQARGDLNAWFVHDWEEEREGLVKRLWDKSKELRARNLKLESELAQLRREKAEREGLERRRDEWLREYYAHQQIHTIDTDLDEHTVSFHDMEGAELGTGPTYEAALAAALSKLEAK
jgi:hypothetical protein